MADVINPRPERDLDLNTDNRPAQVSRWEARVWDGGQALQNEDGSVWETEDHRILTAEG